VEDNEYSGVISLILFSSRKSWSHVLPIQPRGDVWPQLQCEVDGDGKPNLGRFSVLQDTEPLALRQVRHTMNGQQATMHMNSAFATANVQEVWLIPYYVDNEAPTWRPCLTIGFQIVAELRLPNHHVCLHHAR
jgi:hypothetical protein